MALTAGTTYRTFLNMLGLEWPDANEDEVSAYGRRLAQFATDLDTAVQGSAAAVAALGDGFQGDAATALHETAGRANTCGTNLVSAAGQTAQAFGEIAVGIATVKAQLIQQMTAALTVAGLAKLNPATALTDASTQILLSYKGALTGTLERGVRTVFGVAVQAAGALEAAVGPDAVGQVFNPAGVAGGAAQVVTGTGGTGTGATGGAGAGYRVDVLALAACARKLRSHADEMGGHGSAFGSTTADLTIGPGGNAMVQAVEAGRARITQAVLNGAPAVGGVYQQIAERIEQTAANYQATEYKHAGTIDSTSW